jgi:galactokinase
MTVITASFAVERLVELGIDKGERNAKRALLELVLGRSGELEAGAAEHLFWVPGRLEVFGKHTDYAGGQTLVSAVPRGFVVAVARRGDGRVHIIDAVRRQDVWIDGRETDRGANPESGHAQTGWRNYVQTVVRRLSRNFPGPTIGADIILASDLPRASGMSSSSALMIGAAAALGRVGGIHTRPEWITNIRQGLDAASYYACIENGMSFGTLAGDAGVGTHGGSEDHAAIVAGKPGSLSSFAFVPLRHVDDVRMPDDWCFVVTPSGIAADKTGGAKGPYNNLARGAAVLLSLWNGSYEQSASLAAALATAPDAAVRLRELTGRSRVEDWSPGKLTNRLDHFIRENARIPLAVEAFRQADAAALDRLSADSQRDAEILLGNQVPETAALAGSARGLGAFAASSFGAGFGGSVWALLHRDAARDFTVRWRQGAFIATPAPPLSEL